MYLNIYHSGNFFYNNSKNENTKSGNDGTGLN